MNKDKTKNKKALVLKPEILERLKSLSWEKIGRMADNLNTQPQTIKHHIEKETKTLIRFDWMQQIKQELSLNNIEDITIEIDA